MATITFVTSDGRAQVAEIGPGLTLMEGAVGSGIDGIDAVCGGNAYCGTCRVYIAPEWLAQLPEQQDFELAMIESTDDQTAGVRLSCQIPVTDQLDGLTVRMPASQT